MVQEYAFECLSTQLLFHFEQVISEHHAETKAN